MRVGLLVGIGAVATALGMSATANAATAVQFDLADVLNADAIVNGTTLGNLDESQVSVDDTGTSLITQGAAGVLESCTGDPDGLPNKGRFAANGDHPLVELAYRNSKDGKNARRSPAADRYRIAVPHRRYRAIHVFATSGDGDATMRVKLHYRGASSVKEFTVPDWFDTEPEEGPYVLIDNLDRAYPDASACHDENAAAIWGFEVRAKKSRQLTAVSIVRPNAVNRDLGRRGVSSGGGGVLNVFGMTGLARSG